MLGVLSKLCMRFKMSSKKLPRIELTWVKEFKRLIGEAEVIFKESENKRAKYEYILLQFLGYCNEEENAINERWKEKNANARTTKKN